jgi:hypothetical protein
MIDEQCPVMTMMMMMTRNSVYVLVFFFEFISRLSGVCLFIFDYYFT